MMRFYFAVLAATLLSGCQDVTGPDNSVRTRVSSGLLYCSVPIPTHAKAGTVRWDVNTGEVVFHLSRDLKPAELASDRVEFEGQGADSYLLTLTLDGKAFRFMCKA